MISLRRLSTHVKMKFHHTTVLLILVTILHGARGWYKDAGCDYECHSDGSCTLHVAPYKDQLKRLDPISVVVPRCKPCTVVCQERDDGVIGDYKWPMFRRSQRLHRRL